MAGNVVIRWHSDLIRREPSGHVGRWRRIHLHPRGVEGGSGNAAMSAFLSAPRPRKHGVPSSPIGGIIFSGDFV